MNEQGNKVTPESGSNKKDASEIQDAASQNPLTAAPGSAPQSNPPHRRKLFLTAGLVVVLVVAAVLAFMQRSAPKSDSNQTVSIGLLSLMSGDYVDVGQDRLKAIKLAEKDLNYQDVKINVTAKDSQCEDKPAITAFNQLLSQNKIVAAIGEECSDPTLALAPLAKKTKTVLISATATAPDVSDAGDYTFRTVPSDAHQGDFAANLIAGKGYKKIAALHDDATYGIGLDKAFSTTLATKGLSVVDDQVFTNAGLDVTPQLEHIKASNPDALYIMSSDTNSSTAIMLAIKKLGIKTALFGSESLKSTDFAKDAGEAANGLIVTALTDGTQKFKDHFRAEYGTDPTDYIAQTYDAYTALARAIKGGATTGEQIKNFLYKDSFEGASGTVKFDKNGDLTAETYDTLILQDGKFTPNK